MTENRSADLFPQRAITRRRFLYGLGIVTVGAMSATTLIGCTDTTTPNSGDTQNGATKSVETNLATMGWDDILTEAKGQQVTFCAWGSDGLDVMVKQYWDYLQTYVKDTYDIDIVYVPDDTANEQKILTDIETGIDATIDLFWGMGALMTKYRDVDGLFANEWVKKLPSYEYLNVDDARVTFDGTQNTEALEMPFQTLNPSLVYSKDLWDNTIAWDASNGAINGLFHNFTELHQWVQKYPGKFTYMDINGPGSFHAKCLLRAILAELTDDGNGGWKAVYEDSDNAATRQQKIAANNESWFEWLQSSDASETAFYEKAGYVWAYLNDLKPYLLQGDSGPLYVDAAGTMMQYVLAGDLACTFTTCTSISSRIEATPENYMPNPQIYMLQTSIGIWDYVVITENSTKKAAALVVANAMLDPERQAEAFALTGNGYNIDYDRLTADQKAAFDEIFDSFIPGTSPSVTEIAQCSYSDVTGAVNAWMTTGWDQYVNRA
jgi:ABC-type uncharacterized transport system YnjBCD substrate-binding protein